MVKMKMKLTFPATAQQLVDFISTAIRWDKLIQFNFKGEYLIYSHKDLIVDFGAYYMLYCDGEFYNLLGNSSMGNKLISLEIVEDWNGNSERIH